MEADNLPPEDRMVSLQVDEMQVRKDLQYAKARLDREKTSWESKVLTTRKC